MEFLKNVLVIGGAIITLAFISICCQKIAKHYGGNQSELNDDAEVKKDICLSCSLGEVCNKK